jgi:23S rRNA (guanosine2251-2'-O)-methyltransferase
MNVEIVYIFGKHAVYEALTERPDVVRGVYLESGFSDTKILEKLAHAPKAKRQLLNPKKLPGGLRADAVHQGVIAGISITDLMVEYKTFKQSLAITPDTCLLVLGEVQDPHNVGAVIRSAAAFGISGVLIPPHNQSPVTGTVVKVSAGMAFRIPLVEIRNVNATLRDLKEIGFWVYGLAGGGTASLHNEQFIKPTVFVLGNEGSGLREKTSEVCDELISIPIHTRCESLNAAASAAIVMYTWSAQHKAALVNN